MKQWVLLTAALVCSSAFADIYKCKDIDGKTSFQESPCSGLSKGKPFPVNVSEAPATVSGQAAENFKNEKDALDKTIKRRFVREDLERAEAYVRVLNIRKEAELQKIRSSRNNRARGVDLLADAVDNQRIANDIGETSAKYNSQISDAEANVRRLSRELAQFDRY